MGKLQVHNWFGDIVSSPNVVVQPENVQDIIAILKDTEKYPSPVRAVGSNHSTTACGTADNGTVVDMRKMNRIIEIRPDSVTVEAGALYIDVNQELQKHNLQFHVSVEIGNLTMGSAACCETKDSSMPGEFGQVSSYASVIKMVTPAGEVLEITEVRVGTDKVLQIGTEWFQDSPEGFVDPPGLCRHRPFDGVDVS